MKILYVFGRLSNTFLDKLLKKRTRTIALALALIFVMLSLSYLSAIAQKEVRDPDQGHTAVPLGALVPPDHAYAPVEVKPLENATEVSKPAQPGNYTIVSTNEVPPMVARGVNVESPHPYWNDMDWWFPLYAPPEANQMCLRFRTIDVENNFDFVEVYDSTYTLRASYTGYYWQQWTPWIGGNLLWIRLHTDGSNAYWGFAVDRLSWGAPVYAESPHPYTENY
jgi:hypothetical protein